MQGEAEHGDEDLAAEEHEEDEDYELGVREGFDLEGGHAGGCGGGDGHEEEVEEAGPRGRWVPHGEGEEEEGAEDGDGDEVEEVEAEWIGSLRHKVEE